MCRGGSQHLGKYPEGIDAQCAQMSSETLRKILDTAGATVDDVVKINVWLKDRDMRPHVNKEWLAMFPDPHCRRRSPAAFPESRLAGRNAGAMRSNRFCGAREMRNDQ